MLFRSVSAPRPRQDVVVPHEITGNGAPVRWSSGSRTRVWWT